MSILMSLAISTGHLFLVAGVGTVLVRRCPLTDWMRLPAAFIAGTVVFGFTGFGLAHLGWVRSTPLLAVCGVALLGTLLSGRELAQSIRCWTTFLAGQVLQRDRWSLAFLLAMGVILTWLYLLAGTPPRHADSMRYHLAQLAEIVRCERFNYHPYYCYNFPLHFSMTYLSAYVFGAGTAIKFIVLAHFLAATAMTLRLAHLLGVRLLRLLSFLMLLTPICYHEATIVKDDWPLICFVVTGLAFLCARPARLNVCQVCFSFVALGIAMGTKYHAVLFLPWFCWLGWDYLTEMLSRKRAVLCLLFSVGLMSVIAGPSYLRNAIFTGTPTWPLMQGLFSPEEDYTFRVMERYSTTFSGTRSVETTVKAIRGVVRDATMPVSLWVLAFAGAVVLKTKLRLGFGFLSYFTLWWILQPSLFWRFSVFLLPVGLLAAVLVYQAVPVSRLGLRRRICEVLFAVSLIFGSVMAVWYSSGLLTYYVHQEQDKYHWATWYYPEYDWINENLPRDAKLLVIAQTGQTHYLDRSYVRGDPLLSGLIDWESIRDPAQFDCRLRELNVDYVFYDEYDWSGAVGGRAMMGLMNEFISSENVETVWRRPTQIVHSRIRGNVVNTSVVLLRLVDNSRITPESESRNGKKQDEELLIP